jgi:polysaccharide export outer membrane protein
MHLQRTKLGDLAIRLLQGMLLLGILTGLAASQDAPTAATAAAPATASKPAQPATPDNLPKSAAGVRPDSYIIGAEDVITVYVWKEPDMTKTVPVRPDGMISLPLIGEIKAAGYTPVQLQDVVAESMKKLISDPQVTVIVEKVSSLSFNIVGEVNHPGYFPLTRRMTVLDALAMAGGFKDFAKTKKVYVLRTAANGTQERLPFNYKDVINGKNPQQNIELLPRDTVVVP